MINSNKNKLVKLSIVLILRIIGVFCLAENLANDEVGDANSDHLDGRGEPHCRADSRLTHHQRDGRPHARLQVWMDRTIRNINFEKHVKVFKIRTELFSQYL